MNKRIIAFCIVICFCCCFLGGCESPDEPVETISPREVTLSSSAFMDMSRYDVWKLLEKDGFTNLNLKPMDDLSSDEKDRKDIVERVTIHGQESFSVGDIFMSDVEVNIYYHNIKMLFSPFSDDEYEEIENYETVKNKFVEAGFINIRCEAVEDLVLGILSKEGQIAQVLINGQSEYKDYDMFPYDAEIVIKYHSFPSDNEEVETAESDETSETPTPDETILTIYNNEDLKKLVSLKDPADPFIKEFAEKYNNRTIEFDGNIAYLNHHKEYETRYDILLSAGDYDSQHSIGPNFQFVNVNAFNLKLETLFLEDVIKIGKNVHITAIIKEYYPDSTLLRLEPVSVSIR